jgi:autotransporter adhesin
VNPTDAVNVGQLNAGLASVDSGLHQQINDTAKAAYAGTANAIAMANLHYDERPGNYSAAAATGYYHGQVGLAIGVGGTSGDGLWRVSGGITVTPTLSHTDYGIGAGVSRTLN